MPDKNVMRSDKTACDGFIKERPIQSKKDWDCFSLTPKNEGSISPKLIFILMRIGMIKKLIQTMSVLSALNCGEALAHAVVTETSLKINPIQAGKESQVSLILNSRVELALSHFDLVKKGDIHERLAAKQGDKRGEVIVEIPALETGEHAIRLKVFAADGHLTEDIIRFHVIE